MDREKLRDFVVLSETLNYSEAAEQLFMSQSALSKRIKALEKALGEALFIRDTRNIRLSRFGEEFLPFARQILTGYDSADMFLSRYKKIHAKQVTLGSISNPECFHIDEIYVGFEKAHPEIKLNLMEDHLSNLDELFRTGKVNLYCTCDLILHEDTEFVPVGHGYLAALCPEDDPLAGKDMLSPEDLISRNLLLPSEADPFYTTVFDIFSYSGQTPSVVYKGAAVSSISLVKAGVGISLLPVEIAERYSEPGIRIIRFTPEVNYIYGLGYRDPLKLTESERLFVEYVREYVSK